MTDNVEPELVRSFTQDLWKLAPREQMEALLALSARLEGWYQDARTLASREWRAIERLPASLENALSWGRVPK